MSKPTLLLAGNLKENDWSPKQEELDKEIPINYITKWYDQRIPTEYGGNPKIKSQSVMDKILILQSSTGSGKSTIIGPYFYQLFYERIRRNIAITEPRVLVAIEIPRNTIPPLNTREALVKEGHPNWKPLVYGNNLG